MMRQSIEDRALARNAEGMKIPRNGAEERT